MKKKYIVIIVLVIIFVLINTIWSIKKISKIMNKEKDISNNSQESIDWDNIEADSIKFKIKNSTGNNISKIYIKNNKSEDYLDIVLEEINDEEEKEVTYSNYSQLYSWDMKIVFEDGTEKNLESNLAANELYNGATIEFTDLGSSISAVNPNMGNPIENDLEDTNNEKNGKDDENEKI